LKNYPQKGYKKVGPKASLNTKEKKRKENKIKRKNSPCPESNPLSRCSTCSLVTIQKELHQLMPLTVNMAIRWNRVQLLVTLFNTDIEFLHKDLK
jgi:hypothetical protein